MIIVDIRTLRYLDKQNLYLIEIHNERILCYLICSLRCEAKITSLEGAITWRTSWCSVRCSVLEVDDFIHWPSSLLRICAVPNGENQHILRIRSMKMLKKIRKCIWWRSFGFVKLKELFFADASLQVGIYLKHKLIGQFLEGLRIIFLLALVVPHLLDHHFGLFVGEEAISVDIELLEIGVKGLIYRIFLRNALR